MTAAPEASGDSPRDLPSGEDGSDRAPPTGAGRSGGQEAPRSFAVGYERQSGDMLVYGGIAVAAIGVLAVALNGSGIFGFFILAGLVSAAYFWPLTERLRPQLGGSPQGLYVDRIGIIGWPAIADLDLHVTALRSIRIATLRVRLAVPLDQAVVAVETVPLSKVLTTRNWKLKGDVLEVRLHTLTGPPDRVFQRLKAIQEFSDTSPRT